MKGWHCGHEPGAAFQQLESVPNPHLQENNWESWSLFLILSCRQGFSGPQRLTLYLQIPYIL